MPISLEEIGYSVTHFSVVDGLPIQHVTALAQTPDGYLWIGSTAGLIRYDGSHFRVYPLTGEIPELKDFGILNMHCDSKGCLWMSAIDADRVVAYDAGEFKSFGADEGLPFLKEARLGEGPDGVLWVRHDNESCSYYLKEGRFEKRETSNLEANEIDVFRIGDNGLSWAVRRWQQGVQGPQRSLYRFSEGKPEPYLLKNPDGNPERTLGRFFGLRDKRAAIASTEAIYELKDGEWHIRHAFSRRIGRAGEGAILDAVEDPSGNYWISVYDQGLVFTSSDGMTKKVMLPHRSVNEYQRALIVDTEGNVWVAGTSGLFRIKRQIFQQVHGAKGKMGEFDPKAFVEGEDGRVRIGYISGWADEKDSRWEFSPHGYARDVQISSMVSGAGGVTYVGYQTRAEIGAQGFVEKLYLDGKRERIEGINGKVMALLEDKDGMLWIAARGLWRWDGEKLEPVSAVLSGAWVYGLVEDEEGTIYASVDGYGLIRRKDERWKRVVTTNAPNGESIKGLHLDPDGMTIWASCGKSFSRWKNGRWFVYPQYNDSIEFTGVAVDDFGGVWLGSNAGVFRIDRSLLDVFDSHRMTTLNYEWFDRSDGLPTDSIAPSWLLQSAIFRGADGRVWIATGQGAVVADPLSWIARRDDLPPPPVHIESVIIDDKLDSRGDVLSSAGSSQVLEVNPGRHRVEFKYTAINLTAHKQSRFRYRLVGLESQWVDADVRREAIYHDLTPGDYRFEVIAENKNGVWTQVPASLDFTVLPKWWQRASVQIAAIIFLLLVVYGMYWMRVTSLRRKHIRQVVLSRQLLGAQEQERKRIAHELHDNLGQNLLVIKNGLLLETRKEAVEEENVDTMTRYAQMVGDCLSEVRQMSQDLRPHQVDRLGLKVAIESIADRFAASSQMLIEHDVDDLSGAVSSENEIHILRVVQEALSNAVKHSDASLIELEIRRTGWDVEIRIQDDGRGFSLSEASARKRSEGGMGLGSIQERIDILNGACRFTSEPGKGTLLKFVIPEETKNS